MTQTEEAIAMDGPLPQNLLPAWEAFLHHDGYKDIFHDNTLNPLQRKNESRRMLQIANGCEPETVMEIGADKGGSVYLWLTHCSSIRMMIVCEVRGTPYRHLFEERFPDVHFLWLPGSSYDPKTRRHVSDWLEDRDIDVLFLDGDKSHFDTDFNLYNPMVSNDGVILFHDVNGHGPMRDAWLDAALQHSGFDFIDIREVAELQRKINEEGYAPSTQYENWLLYWKGRSCGFGAVYK